MPGPSAKVNNGRYDEAIIKEMLLAGCNIKEVAAVLGCHRDSLTRNDEVKGKMESWEAERSFTIKKVQMEIAVKDKNPQMLIWLGKQYCGQKEPDKQITVTASDLSDDELHKKLNSMLQPNDRLPKRTPRHDVSTIIDAEIIEETQDKDL